MELSFQPLPILAEDILPQGDQAGATAVPPPVQGPLPILSAFTSILAEEEGKSVDVPLEPRASDDSSVESCPAETKGLPSLPLLDLSGFAVSAVSAQWSPPLQNSESTPAGSEPAQVCAGLTKPIKQGLTEGFFPGEHKAVLHRAENAGGTSEKTISGEKTAETAGKSGGTPVAKQDFEMAAYLPEMEIVEALPECDLATGTNDLPRFEKAAPVELLLSAPGEPALSQPISPAEAITAAEPLQDSSRALVHALREQVILMRKADQTQMSVVLPAREGESLHLQLSREDGVLAVTAACSADAFLDLNAHWPELKESLSAQGVHLNDLEMAEENLGGDRGERETPGHFDHLISSEWEDTEEVTPVRVQFQTSPGVLLRGWQALA